MHTPRTADDHRAEAERLATMSTRGTRVLALVVVLALVFTMVNVQTFASQGHQMDTFQWWIAWLLDPMASITMGTAIVFEWVLASYGRKEKWLTATKWLAGVATLVMNTWSSFFGPTASLSGVVLHVVAPALLLFLAEAAPRAHRHLTEIITELHAKADQLDTQQRAQLEAERQPVTELVAPPPPIAPPARPPAPAPNHQVPGDLAALVTRARALLAETPDMGRGRLADELKCSPHQARQVLAQIKPKQALAAA